MSIKPTNIPKCHLRKSAGSAGNISRHCKLGELTENIRTFALPNEPRPYTFKMKFRYDSWNRIQKIIYPDGEKVSYDYNLGGMLKRVAGEKNGDTYKYIEEIRYNPFEQKEAVFYGNGTRAYYNYDVLLRLSHLQSICADGVMQDIDYDYDEVCNINFIENHAGTLPNTLGGTYRSDYTYDNLYRLTYAAGNWHGNNTLYYETSLEYEKNGRISRKVLNTDTWLNGGFSGSHFDNRYHYDTTYQPNTVRMIDGSHNHAMDWDAKGNMLLHHNGYAGHNRRMCWDEQNRLQGVVDYGQQLSYYQYDAGGERTYKFTGEYTAQNQSGQWHYFYRLDKSTLYASPYIVSNERGYTKHYYAESERIASRIGGGGLQELSNGMEKAPEMFEAHRERANILLERTANCLEVSVQPMWDVLSYLYEWQGIREEETDCYWYHPDHLGSSSWITFSDGKAFQHLHYLPWGEDFVNQRTSSFSSMYTFSAKEKDAETGYSYFGARYYSSDLSIWISVDPQAHKYPSLSPYTYCADNPVKLVDPNGEKIDPESMQAWNTLKSDIIGRKDFLKPFAILNKTTHGVLCKKEAERYNSLCNTLNSMEDLEYSDQLYRLGTIEGSVGNVTLNDDESLTINYCNTANFIHEMTHCVQFERGDIGFFKGGGAQAFTDVYDEIESYTAQAAYDPTTIPNYSKRYTPLTPQWIKHMKYGDGGYIYPNCGLIRYDGNATASDMNRIFTNFLVPLDFEGKLREQPGTYFK